MDWGAERPGSGGVTPSAQLATTRANLPGGEEVINAGGNPLAALGRTAQHPISLGCFGP